MIDHLARRSRAIDAHAPGGHAHPPAARGQRHPELQRARALVAVRALRAEVRDDGVVAERQRLRALITQPFDLGGALLRARHVQRHQRGHEARAGDPGVRRRRLGLPREAGEIPAAQQILQRLGDLEAVRETAVELLGRLDAGDL